MPKTTFIAADGTKTELQIDTGWTLMEAARQQDVPGIVAECGGGAICATCHVRIHPDWLDIVGRAAAVEEMLLEFAPEADETSRLSCQITVTDEMDGLVVYVPSEQAES